MSAIETTSVAEIGRTAPPISEGRHPFRRILAEARTHWHEYDADEEHHVAQGVIPCNGGCPRVTLSWNEDTHLLWLDVRVGRLEALSSEQLAVFLESQAGTALGKVLYDREDGTLAVRSSTVWTEGRESATAVNALFADMKRTLEQEPIRALLQKAA